MPNTTTICAEPTSIFVSAKNNAFPKVSDIVALRMLRPADFNRRGLRVNTAGGFVAKRLPVVGRVPEVQL